MAVFGTYPIAFLSSGSGALPGNITPVFSFDLQAGETITRALNNATDPYSFLVVTGHYSVRSGIGNIPAFNGPTINANALAEVDNRNVVDRLLNYRVGMWYYPMPTDGEIEFEAVDIGKYQMYRVDGVIDPSAFNLDITSPQSKSISSALPACAISVIAPKFSYQNPNTISSITNKIPGFQFRSSYNPNLPISPISFSASGDTIRMWTTASWEYDIPPV